MIAEARSVGCRRSAAPAAQARNEARLSDVRGVRRGQLAAIAAHLKANPQIELVWYDFCCTPLYAPHDSAAAATGAKPRLHGRPPPAIRGGKGNSFRWPNDHCPVAMVEVPGTEDAAFGTSKTNHNEAITALDIVVSLLNTCELDGRPITAASIGLVTP